MGVPQQEGPPRREARQAVREADQSIFKVVRKEGEVLDALRQGQMAFFVAIDEITRSVDGGVTQFREDRERFLRALKDAKTASGARV